jgi:hypothetical protein
MCDLDLSFRGRKFDVQVVLVAGGVSSSRDLDCEVTIAEDGDSTRSSNVGGRDSVAEV